MVTFSTNVEEDYIFLFVAASGIGVGFRGNEKDVQPFQAVA